MPVIQLGGLASGLDTASIISALVANERKPRDLLAVKQAGLQARQSALQDVQSRLRSLQRAADDLSSAVTWLPQQTVASADDTKVSARLTSGAGPGGYTVAVSQLATATQRTYGYTAQGTDTQVTIGRATVTIPANATADQAAAAINSASGTGVVAVKLTDPTTKADSLVLASTTTGAPSDFSASGPALVEDATKAHVGLDAQFTVNGGAAQTAHTNVVSAATGANVPIGVELTLRGLTPGTGVTVSAPAIDKAAIGAKVKAYVDTYNATMDFLRAKTSEKPVTNPQSASDAAKGVLYGDVGLTGLISQLRLTVSQPLTGTGNPSSLDEMAELGVSTGATTGGGTYSPDAVAGRLAFDASKLTAALNGDPASVQRLLGATSGTAGFSQAFDAQLNPYLQTSGILDTSVQSAGTEARDIGSRIADWDQRLQQRQDTLRQQFTQMELALTRARSQGNELMSRLGLNTSN